jgi:hypothetical protein|tara:strand:+ start:1577 stop:1987 length:411 start_codon:yes stop_codon:yes gene_type:complete
MTDKYVLKEEYQPWKVKVDDNLKDARLTRQYLQEEHQIWKVKVDDNLKDAITKASQAILNTNQLMQEWNVFHDKEWDMFHQQEWATFKSEWEERKVSRALQQKDLDYIKRQNKRIEAFFVALMVGLIILVVQNFIS